MRTSKSHADAYADADANADANRIHTKNNMSPSPSVGDIKNLRFYFVTLKWHGSTCYVS